MATHKMYKLDNSDTRNCQHSGGIPSEVLGCVRRGNNGIFDGDKKMKIAVWFQTIATWFHKCLLCLAVVLSFFQSALNEGRAQMLEKMNNTLIMNMTLEQLIEIEFDV